MSRHHFYLSVLTVLSVFSACKNSTEKPAVTELPPPANPKFELLDAAATGVSFQNFVKEDFQNNIVTNAYLYNGGGVAIADFNNDGLQDLYFTATMGSNKLYLNEGNLKFKDVTQPAGVAAETGYKTGVTAVDINQDGWMDLYVCRTGLQANDDRRNLLFINEGNLRFSEKAAEYGLNDMSASNHANFFDYDLDGDLDMYLLNHPVDFENVNNITVDTKDNRQVALMEPKTEYDSDRLFQNNGNGTFTDISQKAGIVNRAWGLSVTVSDFNEDGYPDIYVGNDYVEPDFLYINNKNGTFSNQIDRYFKHTANHTMGVDIADFNNDDKVDVVALDMLAEDNYRQKTLMTTMVLDRYNLLAQYGYGYQFMRNALQINNGNGTFSDVGALTGVSNTDWSWCPLLADFDNDTQKDLFITNGYRRDVSNLDYLHFTVDSLNKSGGITQKRFPNFDDFLKLIPTEPLQNYLFHNNGSLRFENVSHAWGFHQKSYSNGAAYGDLDNDGDLDLVVNNYEAPAFIYKNTTRERGEGNYLQLKMEGKKNNVYVIGARARLTTPDGKSQYLELTPTRGFFSSVEYLLHFGLGKNITISTLEIEWPGGLYQRMDDINANQRLIIKISDAKPGRIIFPKTNQVIFQPATATGLDFQHKENEFQDLKREVLMPHKLSNLGPYIAVADVNSDQLEDVFIGGAANSSAALFLQNKNGTFIKSTGQGWEADAVYEDVESVFFDADKDGDIDLFVASGDNASIKDSPNYQSRLYLNDGKGNFQKAAGALPEMRSSTACATAFDYDGDGDSDLFVGGRVTPGAYPTVPQSFILKNDGGKFSDVTQTVAPDFQYLGMISDLEWTDLNGDGKAELIALGEWMPVTVFKVENGKFRNATADFGLANTNGWWNCLLADDVDGDGDTDLVAGNLGLNSRFRATAQEPLAVFAKDFDKNGQIDPILAWYNRGKQYPLPTKDMIVKQIPSLKKRFLHYDPYAKSTIDEVFAKNDLKAALKLEAKVLQTCIFENTGGGKLQMKPLPVAAQMAPVNQMLCRDFNGDGKKDLLLVGNNYGIEPETGRFDASNGTLLIRAEGLTFGVLPNSACGFWADKEARDLAVVKRPNGKDLILVANNNDNLQVYEKLN